MAHVDHEITDHIDVVSVNKQTGWQKEINYVSWAGDYPKLEIRDWAPGYEKAGKGVRLTTAEARKVREILNQMDLED